MAAAETKDNLLPNWERTQLCNPEFQLKLTRLIPEIDYIEDEIIKAGVVKFYQAFEEQTGVQTTELAQKPYTLKAAGGNIPDLLLKTRLIARQAILNNLSDEVLAALLCMDLFKGEEVELVEGSENEWKQVEIPSKGHAIRAFELAKKVELSEKICQMIKLHGTESAEERQRLMASKNKDEYQLGWEAERVFKADFDVHDMIKLFNRARGGNADAKTITWPPEELILPPTIQALRELVL